MKFSFLCVLWDGKRSYTLKRGREITIRYEKNVSRRKRIYRSSLRFSYLWFSRYNKGVACGDFSLDRKGEIIHSASKVEPPVRLWSHRWLDVNKSTVVSAVKFLARIRANESSTCLFFLLFLSFYLSIFRSSFLFFFFLNACFSITRALRSSLAMPRTTISFFFFLHVILFQVSFHFFFVFYEAKIHWFLIVTSVIV